MPNGLLDQLEIQRRAVDTETYDIIIRQLVDMLRTHVIDIAPDYQRHFVWDEKRQSELIESIYLGIPVPNIFVAENKSGSLEVIDGVQRISSIARFIGEVELLTIIGSDLPLRLSSLTRLTAFNGSLFSELPAVAQQRFLNRSLRFTSLNDKSDFDVRYDLFQRLNTGGVLLSSQEIRNCVYRGAFREDLARLAQEPNLRLAIKLRKDAGASDFEELVLRFLAYTERYMDFESSVTDFLNSYMRDKMNSPIDGVLETIFHRTVEILARQFPGGIRRRNSGRTPLNLFEALSVGLGLVIKNGSTPVENRLPDLLEDENLARFWSAGGTNSRAMVRGRIEYVRNALV